MKKVLIIWPNTINIYNSDFWRNILLYEMEGFLKKQNLDITVYDGTKENTLENFVNLINLNDFDYYLLNAPLDAFDGFEKVLRYLKLIKPKSNVIVYGLSTIIKPRYFKKCDINAFTISGYFEKGILSFINEDKENICNICYKEDGKWIESPKMKANPNEWGFTDLDRAMDIDVLRVTVSKGCNGACSFCSAYRLHGNMDNRKSVDEVLEYIKLLQEKKYKGIIEFASPTFTINKEWVYKFCEKYNKRNLTIPWRCVTRVDALDSNIIKAMASSGCIRIGVGVETLKHQTQININKIINEDKLVQIINDCTKNNIEILTYLIFGMDNDGGKSIIDTYNKLKELGASPRMTSIVNYMNLNFENSILLSMQSDMVTTKLSDTNEEDRKKVLSIIMGTADKDEKFN